MREREREREKQRSGDDGIPISYLNYSRTSITHIEDNDEQENMEFQFPLPLHVEDSGRCI